MRALGEEGGHRGGGGKVDAGGQQGVRLSYRNMWGKNVLTLFAKKRYLGNLQGKKNIEGYNMPGSPRERRRNCLPGNKGKFIEGKAVQTKAEPYRGKPNNPRGG